MHILEVHLEVTDLEKSLALYSKLIPHTRIEKWADNNAAALVLENGAAFGLWKRGKLGIHNGRGGEHVHFAFRINPEEYEHYFKLIQSQGLSTLEHLWPEGGRSVYFFDYDNHQGEFMTVDW